MVCRLDQHLITSRIQFGLALLLMVNPSTIRSQVYSVKGNISTTTSCVKNSVVTFIDQRDTSKQYSTVSDSNGHFQLSVVTEVLQNPSNVPKSIKLEQNYPNPFSSSTAISYQLNKQSDVSIKIYDILGREVKAFTSGSQIVGTHGILWDGRDNVGKKVAAGIYFYKLHAGNETHAKKMIFSGGSSTVGMTSLSSMSANTIIPRLSQVAKTTGGSFTIRITNTGNTRPKILFTQIPNVVLLQDTTLNLQVQCQIMAYSLCYQKGDSITYDGTNHYLAWSIHLNNITGTCPKTVINTPRNSQGAQWSPNGNYIAFTHESTSGDLDTYLYDTVNDTLIGLLTSKDCDEEFELWSHDSKWIIFDSSAINYPSTMRHYMISVDGTNRRELPLPVHYLYPDDYNTLYDVQTSGKGPSVYHSDLDETVNEFIVDLGTFVPTSTGGVSIRDYNPNTNEILLLFDDPSTALPNMIAKYNITAKRLDTIIVADSGWKCYWPKFSNDFTRIAIAEINIADAVNYTNRISILDLASHSKTVAVQFAETDSLGKIELIDFNPFAFSPDDKYLAFSKNIFQGGPMAWYISYLHVVDLETKEVTNVDFGIDPLWNPIKEH